MAMGSLILGADHEQVEIAFRTSEASGSMTISLGILILQKIPTLWFSLTFYPILHTEHPQGRSGSGQIARSYASYKLFSLNESMPWLGLPCQITRIHIDVIN